MLLACIITNILAIALPSLRISPLLLIRIATIVLFHIAVIAICAVYIQSIGSDMVIFSELFNLSLVPVKPKRLTEAGKKAFLLSVELKQIIVGLLLGDLNAQKQNLNARLRFGQGVLHKEYIMHLYELFKNFISMVPKIQNSSLDKRTGKVYRSLHFNTLSLPCFNELYELFYPLGEKIVPANIGDLLTPLGLAYWLCDDGSFCKTNRVIYISTNGFSHAEVNLLINVLNSKWNLNCTINKHNPGFIIRIPKKSVPLVQDLLKDIMPKMMMHKIGL